MRATPPYPQRVFMQQRPSSPTSGLPWFDYYAEGSHALDGAETLKRLKSVLEMGHQKGDTPLPENAPVAPDRVIRYRGGQAKRQVREGAF